MRIQIGYGEEGNSSSISLKLWAKMSHIKIGNGFSEPLLGHEFGGTFVKFFSLLILTFSVYGTTTLAEPESNPTRSQERLKQIASQLPIQKLEYFETGIYGKIGSSTVFVTSTEVVKDFDQLYPSMVKVLSKKYACFITNKKNLGDRIHFFCRDKRVIVMRRKHKEKLIYFYGDQYMQDGSMVVFEPKIPNNTNLSH
jgi:hypothetical protein